MSDVSLSTLIQRLSDRIASNEGPVDDLYLFANALDALTPVATGGEVVAWTNLYHLRNYLDGSSSTLIVTREREPAWDMALRLSPNDMQFVPKALLAEAAP